MALLNVNFMSYTLGMCTNMNVILPQSSKGKALTDYPVLYLLHGYSDDYTAWCRRSSIERYVEEKGIAVVMPSAHLSYYANMHIGGKYWDFISEELPKICHEFFPSISTSPMKTYVAGLSMGGYGAFKLAFTFPERFAYACSLSGAIGTLTHMGKRDCDAVFGGSDKIKGSENDLYALIDKAKGKQLPKLYFWCGTEDFLYKDNIMMKNYLTKKEIPFTYEESPGNHEWQYWDAGIKRFIELL